ncbi:hypothetical protein [Spirosoma flavum]|uniref:Uncharacterized protein n=1 Tax=Spirosoma flavum TaxID=2048557 RepID=A0ABW6ARV8_9BACT
MDNHKQLLEDHILGLEETIDWLSDGKNPMQAHLRATKHAVRLTESRNRLEELKRYYNNLYN